MDRGGRRSLVELFAEKLGDAANASELKKALIELDERDGYWNTPRDRIVARFTVVLLSAGFILGGVVVEAELKSAFLFTAGAVGWTAFVYDTLGEKAAQFAAKFAEIFRARE
jgi:hypothetical protein